ncbi:MAG: DUF2339 domain-containing protein [Firmicutes bacterium]|nr:DUF2339 domain-containing protein [Bacillota bacterium]
MPDELRRLQEEVRVLQEEQQKMSERLKVIYQWLTHLDKGLAQREAAPPPAEPVAPAEPAPPPPAAAVTPVPPPPKKPARDLEARIGGIWLNRIGMIIFLLGAAFFLKLAYDWGWINETVRIIIGAAAAGVLLGFGERNRRRGFTAFAQGLTGGGIALLYFTIFASFYYYNLISDVIGMSLLILVTIGAVLLALYQEARAVAAIGLLTGFLNPALFIAEEPRFVLLIVYLILLNLGLLALVYFKRWNFLGVLSFVFTNAFLTWTLSYRLGHPHQGLPITDTQIYLSIFLLLFLAPLLLQVIKRREPLAPVGLFLLAAGAVAYYALSWANLNHDFPGYMGWFTLCLAGFYLLVGSALLPSAKDDPRAHFTAFSLAAVLLVVFVPLQLEGAWILAGWTLEAVLLCFLGLRLADKRIRGGFWALLSLALLRLIIVEWTIPYEPEHYRFLINQTALLTFGFIAVLLLLNRLYHRYRKETGESNILAGAAGLLLLFFGSMELYRFGGALAALTGTEEYYENLALMAISLFWGIYAAALMIAGFIRSSPPLRYAAIGLFGMTLGKLLLFDLGFLDLAYRIISLVISGLILLGASYLYQRHRDRLNPEAPQPPEKSDL